MTIVEAGELPFQEQSRLALFASRLPLWLYFAILAWAPYPLGSNRPWAWNLLSILVGLCWLTWGLCNWRSPVAAWTPLRRFPVAIGLGLVALLWGLVQILPYVPAQWAHPLWSVAAQTLGHDIPATVSLDPWRTAGELLKLLTYVAALWLTFLMAQRPGTAKTLLDIVIGIGACYGVYAAVLKVCGYGQFEIFYDSTPVIDPYVSGPFVLHNSYATFAGLSALAALARLLSLGKYIVVGRGLRQWLLSCVQLLFGRGVGYVVAFLICLSTLLASASRAGTLATLCGMLAMLVIFAIAGRRTAAGRWIAVTLVTVFAVVIALAILSGDTLVSRLNDLVDAGSVDSIRLALWDAASRMIGDAPLLGLGLGTFQDAYPLYATQILPYVMDKAHNDYLEFAAGFGLPAAAAWWLGWLWLAGVCLLGAFRRRRDGHFPLLAVGATVLVAVHAGFDFSLQMPAVSLLYATLLGLGLAQSRSSSDSRREAGP